MPDPDQTASLRPALLSDCTSLAALSIEVWLGTYIREGVNAFFADYVLAQFKPAYFAELLPNADEVLIVSENTDGIDGYVRVTRGQPCPQGSASSTEITTLYVQPRHHGKGKGLHLLNAAVETCRNKGWDLPWLAVNSENSNALAFYLHHGFVTVGETRFCIQDQQFRNDVLQYGGRTEI